MAEYQQITSLRDCNYDVFTDGALQRPNQPVRYLLHRRFAAVENFPQNWREKDITGIEIVVETLRFSVSAEVDDKPEPLFAFSRLLTVCRFTPRILAAFYRDNLLDNLTGTMKRSLLEAS